MIEYLNVYKAFEAPVLTGVDLRIESGELLAIVGRSGGGKSVLLKMAAGIILPDRGDVRLDQESIVSANARTLQRLRAKVRYVFQYAALFDSLTVFDNVAYGLAEPEAERMRRDRLVLRVADALERVNLDPLTVMDKLPGELSGGMRKRVGIARAIISDPAILLYDEPVSGLDPVNSAVIHRLIREIGQESGATSVLVTHDVRGALRIADRIALLEAGRIAFVGSPGEFQDARDPVVRAFASEEEAAHQAEALATV